MMSHNMLIETPGGFDYSIRQFEGWALQAGFARTEVVSLAGPASAAIALKAQSFSRQQTASAATRTTNFKEQRAPAT